MSTPERWSPRVKRVPQALLGLAGSGVALWLTLMGRDLGAVWDALRAADYVWLVPYFLVLMLIHLAQTLRWGVLLEPVARVPFWRLNAVAAVGFMALVILPFRLGELARPYLIAERPYLRVSAALSSVVVERVADGLFMAALAAALAFLLVAFRNLALTLRIAHRILGPLSPRLAHRIVGMMDAFFHGLRLVLSRRKVALFFALTAGYRALSALSLALLAHGFDVRLSALESLTVLGVLIVGTMIPAGPGMVGTYQAAVTLGLSPFLPRPVVDTRSVAFANVLWAGQLAGVTALGIVILFSRHVRLTHLLTAPREVERALEDEEAECRAEGERPA